MAWVEIDGSTYRFEDGGVRFFLLIGEESALLIDSGMEMRYAKEYAEQLTDLPIMLFNTHTDPDHVGSNAEFDTVIMNPAELINYNLRYSSQNIEPIFDGDIIDLGGRELRAIAVPGHTPGSTALLDLNSGMLFSGDPIQNGAIFMFGPMRNLAAYILSLQRLQGMVDEISAIYPSHGKCPLEPSIIEKLIEGAQRVESGEIEGGFIEVFGQKVMTYNLGVATFLGKGDGK